MAANGVRLSGKIRSRFHAFNVADGVAVFWRLWRRSHVDRAKIALLALTIFILDTVINIDIVIPVLYVNVILLAMRSGRRDDVIFAGSISIGLTVISFLLTVNVKLLVITALVNNALSVLAIVCVLLLSLKNIRSHTEILRARNRTAMVSRSITLKAISASVVHEVTQPVAAIGANAHAVLRWLDRVPPNLQEAKDATRRTVVEIERAANVISRLRLLMRPGEISKETCDVRTLIEKATEHLRLEVGEAGVEVVLACPPDLTIVADGVLVQQVIVNALSNSVDALRSAGIEEPSIIVEAQSEPEHVRIAVKDSGVGIDEMTLERMFDPFFTTKIGSGMGIGLAVSRSIIEAHGGTIRAFPNIPRGLVIEFTLPTEGAKLQ